MRQPYQVLVFPYRKINKEYQFCIFFREDLKVWQGIAGGVDDNESIIIAAKREAFEEANIKKTAAFIKLESSTKISVIDVVGEFLWGKDTYLITEFAFGVDAQNEKIKLSFEHLEYKWTNYDDAIKLLNWDSNKTALWELNERLKRRDMNESTISNINNTI
ncbi:MAG: NUDIX pyrophosphatase [Clostridia bacterium]|nr:NUDIX pyrophosphatase [Clostridia bacterium]